MKSEKYYLEKLPGGHLEQALLSVLGMVPG
jgi:hypothetical protein